MAAPFTPFLEYGPPPVEVLHPTLREAALLAHQPDLEQNLVQPVFGLEQPIDHPEQEHPETDHTKFDFNQPTGHSLLDQEQPDEPAFGSLVHPQEQHQIGSNKPCSVHHETALPCSQQPQLGSHKPCSGHPDSVQPCSQHLQHDSQQPCLAHPESAHPCSEQQQLGLQQPCSGQLQTVLPCSEQPQHSSQQPCLGHPKFAQPCSKHGLQQPCSDQPESEQPNFDHIDNQQPSFGQPGSEQLQTVQPIVEQPLQVSPDQPIVVVRDGVGQYSVGHETQGPDGQRVSEQGQLITTNGGWEYVIAKKGSYSYTSPEGILVSVDWEADHNGFRIINSTV